MGKTFNSGKNVAKLITFTIGLVPASVRGVDMGVEKLLPEFHKELKTSSWGSLALGDSKAHDYTLDSTINFFGSNNEVLLSKDEIAACEIAAKAHCDATGDDYTLYLIKELEALRASK